MEIIEAIRRRKSIRGYKPGPIPKEILKEILEAATKSPSGFNVQPWEITVIAGELLDNIRRANLEMLDSGAAPTGAEYKGLHGIYQQRREDQASHLSQSIGIARDDKARRAEWNQRGYRFFDSPAAIILSVDTSLDELRTHFDIGIIAQTICLAALNYGLGTCIERQGIYYPEVIRKFTGIPKSKRIIISIAIGYPDWDLPVNKMESQRERIENITTWCGFD